MNFRSPATSASVVAACIFGSTIPGISGEVAHEQPAPFQVAEVGHIGRTDIAMIPPPPNAFAYAKCSEAQFVPAVGTGSLLITFADPVRGGLLKHPAFSLKMWVSRNGVGLRFETMDHPDLMRRRSDLVYAAGLERLDLQPGR